MGVLIIMLFIIIFFSRYSFIFYFSGSYPQQALYPQQNSAPIYPPAMQVSPQAPPYTDAPPAYSEVSYGEN